MKRILQYIFMISIGFPLVFLLVLSLGRQWPYPSVFPKQMTLANWEFMQESSSKLFQTFFTSLGISLTVAFLVTALCFFVSKRIAYSKNRNTYLVLAYIPYLLSPVILAVIFQYYFNIAQLTGTALGVIIAQFLIAFPFGVIIYLNFWNENLKATEELSYTLGGSTFQTFKKVLFPLSKNAILLCFFQVFLISWFEYGLTNLIGIGKVRTLTVSVFNFVNEANIFYAALACCLLVVPPMILVYINKKFIFFVEKNEA
ncbi:ABC transporter permease [Ulvibacter litoralis]|uniref:Putative spermidine/putrescine transport system permease protein n=1 Tax=Ulvibacter litoralis TaxID=227084 RepID=A0A1G7CJR7_9FLAO|nr:ABC transporter permease subunit [Ulvibacter litoralis]SDE38685.1 putative spermidine/putrescine transport system permease protein [Ulvibacter litoralis]